MSDWEYELDEVGPEAEPEVEPIEPGAPSVENAVFFVMGIATAVFLFSTLL